MATEGEARVPATIDVEIVWVEADGSIGRRALALPEGSRVRDALASLDDGGPGAALLEGLAAGRLGPAVYGERCDAATVLHAGDRIELLAGLEVDPKLARRRRAELRREAAARASRGDSG